MEPLSLAKRVTIPEEKVMEKSKKISEQFFRTFRFFKSMLAVKILIVFFISAGLGTVIFFVANYIVVKNNIKKIVASDLVTSVDLIYDAVDLHFITQKYQSVLLNEKHFKARQGSSEHDAGLNELKTRIKKARFGRNGYAFVINSKGDFIIHPNMEGKNIARYEFINEIIKRKKGTIDYDWEGENKVAAFRYYEPADWYIVAGSYYNDFLEAPMRAFIFWAFVVLALEGTIMFIVLYRLILRIIIIPINRAKKIANSISSGDLTITVKGEGEDEVGVMMTAMAEILTTQRDIIATMSAHIQRLSKSSEEMAIISNKMSKMSQDQAAAMEETSAALEQTLASMEQITGRSETQFQNVDQNAAKMAKMATEADDSYKEAVAVNTLMTGTAESARNGEEDLNRMVSEMQNIKESTSKIEEIIKIISDISEQVNLLSLNAAIEAARAGEHGRGFAVVADEISKLAEETAQSAKTITQLVNEGNAQADSGTAIVNRTALTFRKIIESIESTRGTIARFSKTLQLLAETASEARSRTDSIKKISNEISMSTKEQMTTNKEMSATVERVNSDSQELVSYADSILHTSQEIGELSAEIKMQIDKFKIN
jgi:methyl-accepting chemotaxis protein